MFKKAAEIGPIRPPSESKSLLIRFSRNCSWNKCLFCPVYKGESFKIRHLDELITEINYLGSLKNQLKHILTNNSFSETLKMLPELFKERDNIYDAHRILHWLFHKEYTVFLQDGDPLLRKKDELKKILSLLNELFPEITRITAYARAATLSKFSADDFRELQKLKLTRIHTGLESGSANVLSLVKKGIKQEDIINASKNLLKANIEFSLYVMPGLGGTTLSKEHVTETIKVINAAHPSFVRFRTLALNKSVPLYNLFTRGEFTIPSEEDMVNEIRLMIEGIDIQTTVTSGHNLNLLLDVNGKLPEKREYLLSKINRFLSLTEEQRLKFIIARRLNYISDFTEFSISTLEDIEKIYKQLITMSEAEKNRFFLELRSNNF